MSTPRPPRPTSRPRLAGRRSCESRHFPIRGLLPSCARLRRNRAQIMGKGGDSIRGIARALRRTAEYDLYRVDGNRRLCCIIHGLGGEKGRGYWADLARLMRYDTELGDIDVCFWGYASSRNPFANLLALFRRGRRVSTVPEVARALATCLEGLVDRYGYERVVLAGHSLGGAVAVLGAEQEVERHDSDITHICFMATPQSPPWVATAIAKVFRWNPQISWLGSKDVDVLMSVSLARIRRSGIHATYIHYTRDEILPLAEEIEFDRRMACEAVHGWPGTMTNARTEAYRVLASWMTGTDADE